MLDVKKILCEDIFVISHEILMSLYGFIRRLASDTCHSLPPYHLYVVISIISINKHVKTLYKFYSWWGLVVVRNWGFSGLVKLAFLFWKILSICEFWPVLPSWGIFLVGFVLWKLSNFTAEFWWWILFLKS